MVKLRFLREVAQTKCSETARSSVEEAAIKTSKLYQKEEAKRISLCLSVGVAALTDIEGL